ncbi:MAG: hypothetical protein ACK2T2_02630 [Anaerolineales bacterium]
MEPRLARWWPALVALLAGVIYAGIRMAPEGFDPIALAEVGPRYAEQKPDAEPGYDGQFTLYIALDPNPAQVAPYLDVPAYRYQRILLPILGRMLGLGQPALIPWSLLLINLAALVMGTRLLTGLVVDRGYAPVYALIYGLWVGVLAPVGLDLHEPLAYALVILAFVLREKGRQFPSALAVCLAFFAKETTLIFWPVLLVSGSPREWTRFRTGLVFGALAFIVWQAWLWRTFGAPGIGSGGEMATGFEWIPYMGLWRIGEYGWQVLLLFIAIMLPSIVVPSIWGIVTSTLSMIRDRYLDVNSLALWANSLLIAFTPHSTFREPLGIVRLADGMVLGLVLYSTKFHKKRVLNYALFWIAMLFLLVEQA